MKLTAREYFSFNLKSQIQILRDKGVCLFVDNIDENNEIKAYLVFDFYVKVIIHKENKRILNIILMDESGLEFFFSAM